MIKKQIRADLRPAYYDDFQCLASGCRQNCCLGWHITFDKKDYLSLKRQSGSDELNARMEHGLRRMRKGVVAKVQYGEFAMKDGHCPLLREDFLCALQLEKGHGALPHVCRSFPRTESNQPSGYFERTLSPACEGVLKLLWELPDGVDFRSDPLPPEQWRDMSSDKDSPLLPWVQEIRSQCIDVLQCRSCPLPQRILMMGLLLKELADGEEDVPRWLTRAQAAMEEGVDLPQVDGAHALPLFLIQNLRTLFSINGKDPNFTGIQEELRDALGVQMEQGSRKATIPAEPYLSARKRLEETLPEYGYFMENLMVAVFFHLHFPVVSSAETLWKSYVNFCNLYSFYRFLSVLSCREGVDDCRAELFRLIVYASRSLIHNNLRQDALREELFQNDSSTLAHMAILLAG